MWTITAHKRAVETNDSNGASAKRRFSRTPPPNAMPGPLSLPETQVQGHIVRVDEDGFGIVEFDSNVGMAQLGFFTAKTKLVNRRSRKVMVGAAVTGIIEAVDTQIPEAAGPLTLPLKRLELVA